MDAIKISESAGCKVIETPVWTLHILKDGYRLLPPPAWTAELVDLLRSGAISREASKKVVEVWRKETMEKIQGCLGELLRMEPA